ncbi:unnamed protein product, partial [marine sediment metagenome]
MREFFLDFLGLFIALFMSKAHIVSDICDLGLTIGFVTI